MEVRPVEGQIDDLVGEVNKEVEKKNKVLITTLTKRMAEDLTDYLKDIGIRVRYLHSDIDTLERAEIIRDMRLDVFDVLIGINLLREGLIFRRLLWWQSWMRIKKDSCVQRYR